MVYDITILKRDLVFADFKFYTEKSLTFLTELKMLLKI